jgi:predicted transcriptional regulator
MSDDSGDVDVYMKKVDESACETISNLPEIVSIFDALNKEEKVLVFVKLFEGEKVSEIVGDVEASSSTVYNYIDGFRAAGLVQKKSSAESGFEATDRGDMAYQMVIGLDVSIKRELMQKLTEDIDPDLEKIQSQLDSTQFDEGDGGSGLLDNLFSYSSNS